MLAIVGKIAECILDCSGYLHYYMVPIVVHQTDSGVPEQQNRSKGRTK